MWFPDKGPGKWKQRDEPRKPHLSFEREFQEHFRYPFVYMSMRNGENFGHKGTIILKIFLHNTVLRPSKFK